MEIKLAVVGLGRMGQIHALHARRLAEEIQGCRLVALVDQDLGRARELAQGVAVFPGVDELIAAGVADAAVLCTPTAHHQEHATRLIQAGLRVLLEKPMTLQLATDREFARWLGGAFPHSLMLAFQRRFDPPLQHAKSLLDQGRIGRCFKIVSALEDSGPAPPSFRSGGLLKDMSVHNVDEVLWLTGRQPDRAASGGSSVYARLIQPQTEDEYDDGFIRLWFGDDLIAEVQVSRNHVSGYRIETWIFGSEGQIHIGRFEQDRHKVLLEAYGRHEVIERKEFVMPNYGDSLPEFVHRFGPAYQEEVRTFVRCCMEEAPFPVNHEDGLRAMEIIEAAQHCRWTRDSARAIR